MPVQTIPSKGSKTTEAPLTKHENYHNDAPGLVEPDGSRCLARRVLSKDQTPAPLTAVKYPCAFDGAIRWSSNAHIERAATLVPARALGGGAPCDIPTKRRACSVSDMSGWCGAWASFSGAAGVPGSTLCSKQTIQASLALKRIRSDTCPCAGAVDAPVRMNELS